MNRCQNIQCKREKEGDVFTGREEKWQRERERGGRETDVTRVARNGSLESVRKIHAMHKSSNRTRLFEGAAGCSCTS